MLTANEVVFLLDFNWSHFPVVDSTRVAAMQTKQAVDKEEA